MTPPADRGPVAAPRSGPSGSGAFPDGFDPQPVLAGGGLDLSPLRAEDEPALRDAAADPLVWAGHPAQDRHEPSVFANYFAFLLGAGGTLVAREAHAGRVIGCSRFYPAPDVDPSVSIGFTFLVRDHWGGRTNRAMKAAMLGHALGWIDEVWLHIAPTNIRSQTASARLGAVHDHDAVLDLGAGPKLTQCWRLARTGWEATRGGA